MAVAEQVRVYTFSKQDIYLLLATSRAGAENSSNEPILDFPHFSNSEMGNRYGLKQNLDYIYYLKQARPSFACNLFIVESLKTQRRLTTKMLVYIRNELCIYIKISCQLLT